ncbi:hypothetical protein HNR03_004876 [Pseudomonas sp. JAI111]|nr:hypothetical protein [Pseudomonas sp. JAI111]
MNTHFEISDALAPKTRREANIDHNALQPAVVTA